MKKLDSIKYLKIQLKMKNVSDQLLLAA